MCDVVYGMTSRERSALNVLLPVPLPFINLPVSPESGVLIIERSGDVLVRIHWFACIHIVCYKVVEKQFFVSSFGCSCKYTYNRAKYEPSTLSVTCCLDVRTK